MRSFAISGLNKRFEYCRLVPFSKKFELQSRHGHKRVLHLKCDDYEIYQVCLFHFVVDKERSADII